MNDSVQKTTLCFVIKDSKILLLERQNTWYENGNYLPPGGNVDEGEDLKTASARELFEETGISVEPTSLKLFWEYPSEFNGRKFYSYNYLAQEYSGEVVNKEPCRHSDVNWFSVENLPKNTSQVVYDALKKI